MESNSKLLKFSTYFTVFGVTLIILSKIFGWLVTGSVTMLASLVDSLLDICVSIMNLITVHYSLQPPDSEHRFGHGKAEDLAVFIQASFFSFSGIYLIYNAITRAIIGDNYVIKSTNLGIGILIFSISVTLAIVLFQRYVMRRAKSKVIEADSLHYLTDFFTNIASIIGISFASYYGIYWFDGVAAIAISLYIIFTAAGLFKRAFRNLMDHELDNESREKIIGIIKSNSKIIGFHDLKTRYAGVKPFIQFHIELHEETTLKVAHVIAHDIEEKILSSFPNAEILIHQDPHGIKEKVMYKD